MRLDEKARENLEAAERLLPDDEGREGLFNAAVSRMYYAAYLAVADCALQSGMTFTSDRSSYFRHDSLPRDAKSWGILDTAGVEDLEDLYALRITADYYEDQIDMDRACDAYETAVRLVGRLLGDAV